MLGYLNEMSTKRNSTDLSIGLHNEMINSHLEWFDVKWFRETDRLFTDFFTVVMIRTRGLSNLTQKGLVWLQVFFTTNRNVKKSGKFPFKYCYSGADGDDKAKDLRELAHDLLLEMIDMRPKTEGSQST